MATMKHHSDFSVKTYRKIINDALDAGYEFKTLGQYAKTCEPEGTFILRHDLDKQPMALEAIIDVERTMGVQSTTFIRVAGADYNILSYPVFRILDKAGYVTEFGLHSNFIEFAEFTKKEPLQVLAAEVNLLRSLWPNKIVGLAPHRDINYVHNSLPWIEENWEKLKRMFGFEYHAYEKRILDNVLYVNEGFNPHLCWRGMTPQEAIKTGKSIYMLTHPHWWYVDHPFELQP